MEEDILNYLYQLSCFVGHPVPSLQDHMTCGKKIGLIGSAVLRSIR